jgi:SNF2 family DNA or RNA helicase
MKLIPHQYQNHALKFLIHRLVMEENKGAGLFLDPGLGKTSVVLLMISILIRLGIIKKVLIVAPLRVVYSVWPNEIKKWEQFRHLRVSIVHGSPTKRMKAIATPADIYLTTAQSLPAVWEAFSVRGAEAIPWDTLIVDESTLFKSWGGNRRKKKAAATEDGEEPKSRRLGRSAALRKMLPAFERRVILTGTPRAEGLQDLFAQVFIVDRGESLGTSKSKFLGRFFYRGGFGGYQYFPHQSAERLIRDKISPFCLSLSAADHLDLPELVTNDVWVDLPEASAKQYRDMEKKLFLELDNGEDVTPLNAGGRYLACRQIANGGIYDQEDKEKIYHLHTAKIEAVEDLVNELNGKPALVAFQFRHDLDRLRKRWPKLPSIDGRTAGKAADKLVQDWNAGKLPLLAIQPKSLSHGVNMQSGPGRDLIFVGLDDSLETYLQLVARLYRQGVTGQVRVHRILATDTVDEMIRDRIDRKDADQKSFLESLKEYQAKRAGKR